MPIAGEKKVAASSRERYFLTIPQHYGNVVPRSVSTKVKPITPSRMPCVSVAKVKFVTEPQRGNTTAWPD